MHEEVAAGKNHSEYVLNEIEEGGGRRGIERGDGVWREKICTAFLVSRWILSGHLWRSGRWRLHGVDEVLFFPKLVAERSCAARMERSPRAQRRAGR